MIYFIRDENFIKIGYTINIKNRLKTISAYNPHELVLLGCIEGGGAAEAKIHKLFAAERHRNEWFRATENLLTWIKSTLSKNKLEADVGSPWRPDWREGTPLSDELQERLRTLLTKHDNDEKKVAKMFGIGVISVVRAAAGLGLRRGTARVIQLELDALVPMRATG